MRTAHHAQTLPLTPASQQDDACLHGNASSGDWQKDFAAALLDRASPPPFGLVGPDRQRDIKRFNVYRNNVFVGLIDALKAAFPAICRIVGDEFFKAMASIHVALDPPSSPVMLEYGATFPAFIEAFEPANSVPYLADVARLERAWVEAYHAAECTPIALNELGNIDARSLPQLRFTLHPTLRVVRSPFPVVDLWRMNIDGGVPVAIEIEGCAQQALVIRPDADVEVRPVSAGVATFVQSLAQGASLALATSIVYHEDPGFDLAHVLGELFAINAFAGWRLEDTPDALPLARNA